MAGTPHGAIDCLTSTLVPVQSAQEAFKTLFDFLSANPRWTRIAWSKGTTGGLIIGATSGDDYWDGAEPFMRHAWAVFEATNATDGNPWYLLIQLMDGGNDTLPDGMLIDGATSDNFYAGVGIQMVCGTGAGGTPMNPWQGTTVNDGTDTKGSPVWAPSGGGGRLYAFPRNNSVNGDYETLVNNMAWAMKVYSFGTAQVWRFHIVTDDDNFVMLSDDGDDGGYRGITCGSYVPRADLVVERPLMMMGTNADYAYGFPEPQAFGNPVAGGDAYPGGISPGKDGLMDLVVSVAHDRYAVWQGQVNVTPNKAFNPAARDAFPLAVGAYELAPTVFAGYLGAYTFVRDVYNVPNGTTNLAKTRAAFGASTQGMNKLSIPWDGVTVPFSTAVRAGVSF